MDKHILCLGVHLCVCVYVSVYNNKQQSVQRMCEALLPQTKTIIMSLQLYNNLYNSTDAQNILTTNVDLMVVIEEMWKDHLSL